MPTVEIYIFIRNNLKNKNYVFIVMVLILNLLKIRST